MDYLENTSCLLEKQYSLNHVSFECSLHVNPLKEFRILIHSAPFTGGKQKGELIVLHQFSRNHQKTIEFSDLNDDTYRLSKTLMLSVEHHQNIDFCIPNYYLQLASLYMLNKGSIENSSFGGIDFAGGYP